MTDADGSPRGGRGRHLVPPQRLVLRPGTANASAGNMTIQTPPNDDTPLPDTDPTPMPAPIPIDTPQDPEQRAPGADQPPLGAPRDEPDPEG
jgi:hypothetical protein